MTRPVSHQYRLASRPAGRAGVENFEAGETPTPPLTSGDVLLRAIYLSLDPYVRGRMDAKKSYMPPMNIGDVVDGATICEVVETESALVPVGALVRARTGWQTYAVAREQEVQLLDREAIEGLPLSAALGVLGMPGFTAYAGLLQIGKPVEGETVVVAAATGPVGSVVGQLAKLRGARAVGIAGGPVKKTMLTELLGFDVGIDHHDTNLMGTLAKAVPDGIDVYFENVSGRVSRAVFPHLNKMARIPVCGLIADYDDPTPTSGPDRLPSFMRQVLDQSLTVRGFLASQFLREHYADFQRDMAQWVKDGSVKHVEQIVDGLENAPAAFLGLLTGTNLGKLVIRVGDDPASSGD